MTNQQEAKKLTTEKTSLTSPPIGVLAAASNQIKQLGAKNTFGSIWQAPITSMSWKGPYQFCFSTGELHTRLSLKARLTQRFLGHFLWHFLSLFKVLQNLRCKLPMLARTGSTTHPQSKSDCNSWKLPDAHFYHHLLHCVCFQRFPKSKSIKDRLWQKASLDCWIKIVHYAMTTGLRFLHCTQHQPWSLEALSSIHGIKFTSVTTPASHWPRPVHCLPPHWAYLRVFRLLPRDLKQSQLQKASNTSKFPTMPAPSDEDTRPLSKTLSYVVPNLSGGISGGTEGVSKSWAVSHWHSAVWSLSCKNHCCKL